MEFLLELVRNSILVTVLNTFIHGVKFYGKKFNYLSQAKQQTFITLHCIFLTIE